MTLFDAATLKALDRGHDAAEACAEKADADWRYHAEWLIRHMTPGATFLAEDIAAACSDHGFATSDSRALGHVILEAKRMGLIAASGEYRPAKSSNGSVKPVWRRVP